MEGVRGLAGDLRAGYARVLGCDPADVALTGSTTDGVNTVLGGLSLRPGDEIVTSRRGASRAAGPAGPAQAPGAASTVTRRAVRATSPTR